MATTGSNRWSQTRCKGSELDGDSLDRLSTIIAAQAVENADSNSRRPNWPARQARPSWLSSTNSMAELRKPVGSALCADMDLEPPRLQNAIEVLADERQILDRKPPRHSLALSGRENGLLHPLKLQQRPSDARDGIAHEQEQRRLPVHQALVMDR